MKPNKTKDIGRIFAEGTLIDAALAEAAREALRRHKRAGHPIVVWRDGKVVRVPPEDIKLPRMTADGRGRRKKV
ncbi:MAG: hypothetical protein ACREJI_10370 [Candidatus Methylomirabilales bacterium]